jgi:hypothetical protein
LHNPDYKIKSRFGLRQVCFFTLLFSLGGIMCNSAVVALIGCDAPDPIKSSLASLGFDVCELPRDTRLQKPVSSHADMLVRIIGNAVFCSNEYYESNPRIFDRIAKIGYRIVISNAKISAQYPNDIAFNVICAKNALIGRLDRCAAEILELASVSDFKQISVKQGYAACSTLLLGDNALISADSGIVKAAVSLGMSALKTESSAAIRLPGYERGFIGGACGVYKNSVYFCGRLDDHPDSESIREFCSENGFEAIPLCDIPLTDVGGILFLPPLL